MYNTPPDWSTQSGWNWEGTATWECDNWTVTTSNTSASDSITFSVQEVKDVCEL